MLNFHFGRKYHFVKLKNFIFALGTDEQTFNSHVLTTI